MAVTGFGVSLGAKKLVLKVGLVVKPRRLLGHVSRVVFVKVDDVNTQMKRVGVGRSSPKNNSSRVPECWFNSRF
jgi:hypothetical protein